MPGPKLIRWTFVQPAFQQPHDLSAMQALITRCAAKWEVAVGSDVLRIERAGRSSDADWIIGVDQISQYPANIAWCQPVGPLQLILFDTRSRWCLTWWQRVLGRSNGVSFIALCLHEMGHALGLQHGDGGNMLEAPILEEVTAGSALMVRRNLRRELGF